MKPIQIDNINRSDNQPILIKEKISENGEIKTIIYQRKNIESIDGLVKKIKTRIRYAAEDFSQKFDLTSLKRTLGFTSLKTLVEKDESKENLLYYKSKMSTSGINDHEKNQ
jgi:hypothetical protein